MRLTITTFIYAALISFTSAQELDLPDPTAESPAIREQMDAVRGMENLKALRSEMESLRKQNEVLMKQLMEMQETTQQLKNELGDAKLDRQLKDQQRRSVPEMKLVVQVRTGTARTAEIKAGDNVYRVKDRQAFRLRLIDGQVVSATPQFHEDGTIQISLPELNVEHLLAFRPSPPDPNARRDRDRGER